MATIELTKDNFDEHLTQSTFVLIDFWADWCGPCRQFAPVFEAASEKHTDITFAKVDTVDQQELAAGIDIQSIPTLMIVRDGLVVYRQPGALPSDALEDLIKRARELDMEEVRKDIARSESNGNAS